MGKPMGTGVVELDLDSNKLEKGLQRVQESLLNGTAKTEDAFKQLGIKSSSVYDTMRTNAELAFTRIANSAKTTADDRVRAEQAAADKIKSINEQQYGKHISLIDEVKNHWVQYTAGVVAGAALITAAIATVHKAVEAISEGAKALQTEESFKRVAAAANESADEIIHAMRKASRGTIDESDIMQKAVKGMVLGMSGDQMVNIMEAARVSARVTGEDVQVAYEKITDAIATGLPRGLKQYGLATKEEAAIVDQALKAGIEGIDLYKIAMLNAAIQAAKFGELHDTSAEAVQRFHARVKDTHEQISIMTVTIAEGLFPALFKMNEEFKKDAGKQWAEGILKYLNPIKEAFISATLLGKALNAVMGGKLSAETSPAEGYGVLHFKMPVDPAVATKEKNDYLQDIKDKIAAAKEGTKAAEQLAAAWVEASAAMDVKTKESGADELTKKLIEIQGEAEKMIRKFDSIPGATDKIKEFAKAMSDAAVQKSDSAAVQKMEDDLKAEEARILAVDKAYDQLSKSLGLSNSYSEQYLSGLKKINAEFETGKMSVDKYNESVDALAAYEAQAKANADMNLYAKTDGLRSDQFEKAYQETVKSEADILEVKMKALNQYFDKVKWIQDQLSKHSGGEFQKDMQDIATGMQSISSGFEELSQMYSESSNERKKFHELSMAFNIIEKAAMVAKTMNAAVLAVAEQGTAGPYVGFVAMAAMAAAMASLLGSVGIAFSGGPASAPSATGNAASQGSSGVLGASLDTGSQSIANSYKLMEDTYKMEDTRLRDLYNELRDLNGNITGLMTSIVRGTPIGSFAAAAVPADTLNAFEANFGAAWNKFMWNLDFIGSGVTKLVGAIFGGGTTSGVQDTGINIGSIVVKQLIDGMKVAAEQYAIIYTKTSGGMFSSDSVSRTTMTAPLDPAVTTMLTLAFKNISNVLVDLSKAFGTDVNAALNYVFEGLSINIYDMASGSKTTEQINTALQEYFSKISDNAADVLFGTLIKSYQKLNEGLLETAVRLANDKEQIQSILEATNQSFRGDTRMADIIQFSENLIKIAGDLKALSDAASTYFDKFFSDTEKQTVIQKQLSDTLVSMNLVLPDTRAGYRALVEGLDMTTQSGQEAYITLLKLAGYADTYYKGLEDSAAAVAKTATDAATASAKATSDAESARKALNDYWQGAADYYTGLMNTGSAMQNQIDGIIKKFDEYRAAAKGLSNETEVLTVLQKAQSNVIAKIIADWSKALVKPLLDLDITLYEWAQGISGMTKSQIALSTLMIYRAMQGWSAKGAEDVLNFNGLSLPKDSDKIQAYVAELTKYAQTVIQALEATYEALQKTNDAIKAQIQEITVGGMTAQEQADYYAGQIQSAYAGLSSLAAGDVPAAIDGIRSNLTKYYDLEKQMIKDKYQLIFDAENKKFADELSNIQAVRDKLQSLTYSSYNLALPGQKAAVATVDEAKLYAAAQTGDAAAVSRYLAFTDTFLQASQNANKSSQKYLDDYAMIMSHIASLDTKPGKSVEELTLAQNDLIKTQTAAMTAELKKLDDDMIKALNMLGGATAGPMATTLSQLTVAFDIIKNLVAAGYANTTATTGGTAVPTGSLTSAQISNYASDPSSFMADGILTQTEATVAGFVALHDDNTKLYDVATAWRAEFGVWYDRDGAFQQKLYDGLTSWAVMSTSQLSQLTGNRGYADGGISSGPSTGYMAKLHGTELVVSPRNAVPVRMSGDGGGLSDPEIKSLLSTLVVQGSKKQQVTLNVDGRTFTGFIETTADRLDDARQSKGVTGRIYRN